MAINGRGLPVVFNITDIASAILEVNRRAVDGTVVPFFVDYTNQRVIVGGISSAGSNAPFQVQSGDIEITTSGKGVIMPDANGSAHTARVKAIRDPISGNWSLDISGVS